MNLPKAAEQPPIAAENTTHPVAAAEKNPRLVTSPSAGLDLTAGVGLAAIFSGVLLDPVDAGGSAVADFFVSSLIYSSHRVFLLTKPRAVVKSILHVVLHAAQSVKGHQTILLCSGFRLRLLLPAHREPPAAPSC